MVEGYYLDDGTEINIDSIPIPSLCLTCIKKIKKIAQEKDDENWKFRMFLKTCDISSEQIDRIVHKLYKHFSSTMKIEILLVYNWG